MGFLSKKKAPKPSEATTDDSQKSSNTWKNNAKLFPFAQTFNKQKKEQKSIDQSDSKQKVTEDLVDTTDSELDKFQTLMSNSIRASTSKLASSVPEVKKEDKIEGTQYWHQNDPTFMPTAYPLTRTDGRTINDPKWGNLNLASSAAVVGQMIKRFNSIRDKHPRFRLGPRGSSDEHEQSQVARRSESSLASEKSKSMIDAYTPKYTFISQDGKLVEREVTRWPVLKQPKLETRYKLIEPYSKNYGKMAKRRQNLAGQKYTLPRTRYIYQRPIVLMPRRVMEDNKKRLIARHEVNYNINPGRYRLPFSHSLGEREQSRRYIEIQEVRYTRKTKEHLDHTENMKRKAESKDASTVWNRRSSISVKNSFLV